MITAETTELLCPRCREQNIFMLSPTEIECDECGFVFTEEEAMLEIFPPFTKHTLTPGQTDDGQGWGELGTHIRDSVIPPQQRRQEGPEASA